MLLKIQGGAAAGPHPWAKSAALPLPAPAACVDTAAAEGGLSWATAMGCWVSSEGGLRDLLPACGLGPHCMACCCHCSAGGACLKRTGPGRGQLMVGMQWLGVL